MTYNEFIQNIINTRGQWNIPANTYYEAHHIIPRCLGGLPNGCVHKSKHPNIIWLLPQEHYEAHKLLALENPTNNAIIFAWAAISHLPVNGRLGDIEISAEDYAKLAELNSKAKSSLYSGVNNPNYGKSLSIEQRKHLSNLFKNNLGVKNSPRFSGHHHSEVSKTKIRQKLSGQFWITNGIIEVFVDKGSEIPDGFYRGRLLSDESQARKILFQNKKLDNRTGVPKPVYCIELQKDFLSAAQAAKSLNIQCSKISECCHGKRNTAGGYHWQFSINYKAKKIKCVETNKIYSTFWEAALDTGAPQSKICECCNNKRKHAGNYSWCYIESETTTNEN